MGKYIDIQEIELAGFAGVAAALHLPFGKECQSEHSAHINIAVGKGLASYGAEVNLTEHDVQLISKLVKAGDEHAKVVRGIMVWAEINAPRYWWQEMDTYRVGTDRLASESTMHIQCKGMPTEELIAAKAGLTEGTMQRRVQVFSYQCLRRIYKQRKHHRLPHWHEFCEWIESLPYAAQFITAGLGKEDK